MFSEQILTYIGMAVVILFAIYYVYKVMQVQNNVIEGLSRRTKSKDTSPTLGSILDTDNNALKKSNEKASDVLLISKYRSKYEDLLLDLDTTLDNNILRMLGLLGLSVDDNGDIIISKEGVPLEFLQGINELYKLKNNLNTTMDFLDSTKSSKASSSYLS